MTAHEDLVTMSPRITLESLLIVSEKLNVDLKQRVLALEAENDYLKKQIEFIRRSTEDFIKRMPHQET